jgi:hypothetical protein
VEMNSLRDSKAWRCSASRTRKSQESVGTRISDTLNIPRSLFESPDAHVGLIVSAPLLNPVPDFCVQAYHRHWPVARFFLGVWVRRDGVSEFTASMDGMAFCFCLVGLSAPQSRGF